MWYFTWVLGTALAAAFAILCGLQFEIKNEHKSHSCANSCGKNGHH